MKLVLEGWPADKHETPVCAVPYFDVHDCLSVVDGILLKGEAVVIPMALRSSIKKWLYSAHLGRDSVLCWARGRTTGVLAQHGQWHQANSWYVWNLQGNEATESTRTTKAAHWWRRTMAEDWSWFLRNCWESLFGSARLLLQLYRDWFTYDDECPYCEIAQEALCSLWQTKNDCVGCRSTVY